MALFVAQHPQIHGRTSLEHVADGLAGRLVIVSKSRPCANTPSSDVKILFAARRQLEKEAAAQKLPLRYMGPQDFSSELERLDGDYRALWRVSPWEN